MSSFSKHKHHLVHNEDDIYSLAANYEKMYHNAQVTTNIEKVKNRDFPMVLIAYHGLINGIVRLSFDYVSKDEFEA